MTLGATLISGAAENAWSGGSAASTTLNTGTLTITSGALQAAVTLFGSYVTSNFKLVSDGAYGTLVTDPVVGDQHNLLTQPHA